VDGLIKHGEWSFLALTGSELGNGDTVFLPVVDLMAVAASVTEVVMVLVAWFSDVVEHFFVVGIDLPAVSFCFNVTGEKVSELGECHV